MQTNSANARRTYAHVAIPSTILDAAAPHKHTRTHSHTVRSRSHNYKLLSVFFPPPPSFSSNVARFPHTRTNIARKYYDLLAKNPNRTIRSHACLLSCRFSSGHNLPCTTSSPAAVRPPHPSEFVSVCVDMSTGWRFASSSTAAAASMLPSTLVVVGVG